MTTMIINLEEKALDVIRQKAQKAGQSPETWVAEAAVQKAESADERHWVDRFLEIADRAGGDSRGQTWTREDLYKR
jgi:hypothetical protein